MPATTLVPCTKVEPNSIHVRCFRHLRRVVAFNGNERPGFLTTIERAAAALPDSANRALLVQAGFGRLVVHVGLMPEPRRRDVNR